MQGFADLNVRTSHSCRKPNLKTFYPYHFFVSVLIFKKLQKTIIFKVRIKLNISRLQL